MDEIIASLRQAIAEKISPHMVVHTRLENRWRVAVVSVFYRTLIDSDVKCLNQFTFTVPFISISYSNSNEEGFETATFTHNIIISA